MYIYNLYFDNAICVFAEK